MKSVFYAVGYFEVDTPQTEEEAEQKGQEIREAIQEAIDSAMGEFNVAAKIGLLAITPFEK